MKTYWENDGQPNEDGNFAACVDIGDGAGVQRFEGKSEREVADKLLEAQANASSKIRELAKANRKPDLAQPKAPAPAPLTADDQFMLAEDLKDGTKAPAAIVKVVESMTGVPLKKLGEKMTSEEMEAAARAAGEAAHEFAEDNRDFYKCQHNSDVLMRYMQMNGWPPTKNNFEIAFQELKEQGLMRMAPVQEPDSPSTEDEEEEDRPPQPEPKPAGRIVPATRPRGAVSTSTGVRSGDSSAAVPVARSTAQPKYTKEQILHMSQKDYDYKFKNEAGFAQLVDKLFEPKARVAR